MMSKWSGLRGPWQHLGPEARASALALLRELRELREEHLHHGRVVVEDLKSRTESGSALAEAGTTR